MSPIFFQKRLEFVLALFIAVFLQTACGGQKTEAKGPDSLDSALDARLKSNPDLLPVEAFSGLPAAEKVRLSPSGKYLSFLHNKNSKSMLVTLNLETKKKIGILETDNIGTKILWYEWVSDDYLIFSLLYLAEDSSVKYNRTRLFRAVPDASKEAKVIVEPQEASTAIRTGSTERMSQIQDNVIDFLPDDPEHVLLSADFEEPLFPGVYSLDVTDGSKKLIHSHKRPNADWMTDQQGRVRIGIQVNSDFIYSAVNLYDLQEKSWRKAWDFNDNSDAYIIPMGFGLDPNTLYIKAYHNDKKSLFKVDLSDPNYPRALVASDPKYDIDGSLIYSPKTKDVVGVYHGESEDVRVYFDEEYKRFQDSINKVLPHTTNYIVDVTKDGNSYVVFATSDVVPGQYLIGDKKKKTLDFLFDTYPLLTDDKLRDTKKLSYKARDGVEIEAFLTLPKDESQGPVPVVVHPHGGPASRDYGGFDYWKAFFINRGYAVFQPNFRGSKGYGKKFREAALQRFGQETQDDITDGVKWLIDEGIANSDKICIVGASFGGYSALMGAVKTPDLYRCAISFAGVSDLKDLRNEYRFFANYDAVKAQIGTDLEMLKKHSPLRRVEEINVPILMVHGEDDTTVSVEQSRDMAKALEKAGKKYKYVELEKGTHYLINQKNRTRLFQEMDLFLADALDCEQP